jgi:hypothetical protein
MASSASASDCTRLPSIEITMSPDSNPALSKSPPGTRRRLKLDWPKNTGSHPIDDRSTGLASIEHFAGRPIPGLRHCHRNADRQHIEEQAHIALEYRLSLRRR